MTCSLSKRYVTMILSALEAYHLTIVLNA